MKDRDKANAYNNLKLNNVYRNVSLRYSGAFFAIITALFSMSESCFE